MLQLDTEGFSKLSECRCILTNLDYTLIDTRAPGAAVALLKDEFLKRHYKNVFNGTKNFFKISAGTRMRKGSENDLGIELWGLSELYKTLSETKIKKKRIQEITKEFVQRHALPGAKSCIKAMRSYGINKAHIISSINGDLFVEPAAKYFEATGYVTNRVLYTPDDCVERIDISMKTDRELVAITEGKLNAMGFRLKDCAYITSSNMGLAFKDFVKIFVSAPNTTSTILAAADLKIYDYGLFEMAIRKISL